MYITMHDSTDVKNGYHNFCCKICVVWAACGYCKYISLVTGGAICNNIEFYWTMCFIWYFLYCGV